METQLQYFNGKEWVDCGPPWPSEFLAWVSLGDDFRNYRTVSVHTGEVLTDKRVYE